MQYGLPLYAQAMMVPPELETALNREMAQYSLAELQNPAILASIGEAVEAETGYRLRGYADAAERSSDYYDF